VLFYSKGACLLPQTTQPDYVSLLSRLETYKVGEDAYQTFMQERLQHVPSTPTVVGQLVKMPVWQLSGCVASLQLMPVLM